MCDMLGPEMRQQPQVYRDHLRRRSAIFSCQDDALVEGRSAVDLMPEVKRAPSPKPGIGQHTMLELLWISFDQRNTRQMRRMGARILWTRMRHLATARGRNTEHCRGSRVKIRSGFLSRDKSLLQHTHGMMRLRVTALRSSEGRDGASFRRRKRTMTRL